MYTTRKISASEKRLLETALDGLSQTPKEIYFFQDYIIKHPQADSVGRLSTYLAMASDIKSNISNISEQVKLYI